MNLPQPASQYDRNNEAQTRGALEKEDRRNRKVGTDVEIGNERLILKDTVTGNRYSVTVTSGVLGIVAL